MHKPLPTPRIPLTVIGGFLGAGKTSLLVHWLKQAQGQRIAVLVNDFGAINIDAELLSESNSDTIALSNGCVCCQIGGDLSQALLQVLDKPQPFDAIVIEASGVSDPWPIAQIALADKRLSLHGVLVVVDAAAVRTHAADPLLNDSLLRQLRAADLLVLNKTDLCSADEIQACATWLHDTVGPVPCLHSQYGQLPVLAVQAGHGTDGVVHPGGARLNLVNAAQIGFVEHQQIGGAQLAHQAVVQQGVGRVSAHGGSVHHHQHAMQAQAFVGQRDLGNGPRV